MKKAKLWIIALTLLAFTLAAGSLFFGIKAISNIDSQQEVVQRKAKHQSQPPTREELLILVNKERAKVGVAPLQIDQRLNQSAQYKADDMAKHNYGHTSSYDGRHGYEYIADFAPGLCSVPSENIAGRPTATRTVDGWVKSPSHYQAMINPKYTLTGFGIAKYGDNAYYEVEHFCQQ